MVTVHRQGNRFHILPILPVRPEIMPREERIKEDKEQEDAQQDQGRADNKLGKDRRGGTWSPRFFVVLLERLLPLSWNPKK